MIELRDYQRDAIAELDKLWADHRAIILEMTTGAGKTVTTAAWLDVIIGRQPNTIGGWMVHTGHLREQAGEELDKAGVPWVDWSTIAPHKRRWEPGRVHCFGSTMTLPAGPHQTETVLVVDECHRSASPTYAKEMDRRRGQARHRRWRRLLGLSGTPARYLWPDAISDSQRKFAGQWDAMVRGPSPAQLVEAGHLADVVVKSIDEAGGDWEVLRPDAMRTSGFTVASERRWERTLSVDAAVAIVTRMEPRPTLWFCASVQAAKQVQKLLGRRSAAILATTSASERRRLIDAFSAREIDHLVTVRALLEGTDIPIASRIALLAPSSSRLLLAQAAGRTMRPSGEDSEFCDFSRSWEHLGAHPLDDVPWHLSLDVTATAAKVEAATSRAWTCPTPGCGTVVSPRTQRLCPTCHFEVVRRCVACWLPMTPDTEDGTHRRHLECGSIERALHTKWARDHGVDPVADLDATADIGGPAEMKIGRDALEKVLSVAAILEHQVGQR